MRGMAEPHPVELRERVVKAYESGDGSYASVAELFSVGEASVKRWVRQYRDEGHLNPQRHGGGTPSRIRGAELDKIIAALGDANAGEITVEFNRRRRGRNRVHVSSIKRALYRHSYVVKKNASGRWNSFARTSSSNAPPS